MPTAAADILTNTESATSDPFNPSRARVEVPAASSSTVTADTGLPIIADSDSGVRSPIVLGNPRRPPSAASTASRRIPRPAWPANRNARAARRTGVG